MLDAASPRASRLNRYRATTTRLNARRGSEQYHAMNSSMANSYVLREAADTISRPHLLGRSPAFDLISPTCNFLRRTDSYRRAPVSLRGGKHETNGLAA